MHLKATIRASGRKGGVCNYIATPPVSASSFFLLSINYDAFLSYFQYISVTITTTLVLMVLILPDQHAYNAIAIISARKIFGECFFLNSLLASVDLMLSYILPVDGDKSTRILDYKNYLSLFFIFVIRCSFSGVP